MLKTKIYLWSMVSIILMVSTESTLALLPSDANSAAQKICEDGDIEAVPTAYKSRTNKAYETDGTKLFRYPPSEYGRPEAVARLEFAKACLELRGELEGDTHTDTCTAMNYLRFHDLFDRSDLRDLEDYYLRSRNMEDISDEGLLILKAAASCYYR